MIPYREFRPTGFDPCGLGLSDRQDWLVLPVTQNRDSGIRARSNFEVAQAALSEVDTDEKTWEVHRFGHWGPGWFEIILVQPDTRAAEVAEELDAALATYPFLSDEHHSQMEFDEACSYWDSLSVGDRIRVCVRFGVSIFAARRDEIPRDETGELLGYLAS